MKKSVYVLFMVATIFTSCQLKTKDVQVDLNASKNAVNELLDKQFAALIAMDADAYLAYLADDVLICGTDPEEFWNKSHISELYTQMLADTALKFSPTVDKREIRISKDGNSAIVVEQMFIDYISPKVPVRTVYHLFKNNETWQIDFYSSSLIPRNSDLSMINKLLE